jgi:hypothetical protein
MRWLSTTDKLSSASTATARPASKLDHIIANQLNNCQDTEKNGEINRGLSAS